MLKRFLLAAVAVAVCSSTSYAQSNFTTAGLELVFDNVAGAVVNNQAASDTEAFIESTNLDDVTFAATTRVEGVEFSGIFASSPSQGGDAFLAEADQNFTINIFGDNGAGVADTAAGAVASFNVGNQLNRVEAPNPELTAIPNLLSEAFDFAAPIDFTFAAGETFHLQIVHASPASDADQFNQAVASNAGNAFSTLDPVNLTNLSQQTFATDFQLFAAIPEPSSAVLLALGFAGFAARRRRR